MHPVAHISSHYSERYIRILNFERIKILIICHRYYRVAILVMVMHVIYSSPKLKPDYVMRHYVSYVDYKL